MFQMNKKKIYLIKKLMINLKKNKKKKKNFKIKKLFEVNIL